MSSGPTPPSALPTVTGAKRRSTAAIETNRIDRYFVLERLGQGGMGVVVSAYDPELDRRVAIKLLQTPRDARARLRLLREAQAMARLSHPNVVHVYDVGMSGDLIYLAMELVVGQTMRAWLKAERRSWREIVQAFVAAGRGLTVAHAEGIVHRDFKPENVLIGRDGRVRVADFGIASWDAFAEPAASPPPAPASYLHHAITATGGVVGTPRYMAPEQHAGLPVGPAADQFSFCVALHEALYGELPYVGDTPPELAENVTHERYRSPADPTRAPKWLAEVVRQGLRAEPSLRHASFDALLERLEDDPSARTRRRLRLGIATLAFGPTAGIAAWSWSENAAGACSAGETTMAQVWNADARARMGIVFGSSDDTATADVGRAVERTIDGWVDGWTAAHREMCLGHRDGSVSGPLLDASMACLDRDRGAFERLLEVVDEAQGPALERVAVAATKLPRPADCTDRESLVSAVVPAHDPDRVEEVRRRLAAAKVRHDAGDVETALAELAGIADHTDELGYDPLTAEVSLVAGRLAMDRGSWSPARAELQRAAARGIASGLDVAAAEAEARLVFVDAVDSDRPVAALARVDLASALAERVGDPPWLQALLANNVGAVHGMLRDRDRAAAEFAVALEIAERTGTVDPVDHAAYASNLARLTADPQHRDELFARAEAIVEAALGRGHSERIDHAIARAFHTADSRAALDLLAPACRQLGAIVHVDPLRRHLCWWREAELHDELGDAEAALAAARAALAELQSSEEVPPLVDAVRAKASAYVALLAGDAETALAALDDAEARFAPHRALPWIALDLADLALLRARALDRLGRAAEAVPDLRDALAIYERQMQDLEDRAAHLRSARVRPLLERYGGARTPRVGTE